MSFHEIRFPPRLSLGSIGGPERLTEIVTLINGHEERNTPWAHSRRRYDAGLGMQSLDDVSDVIAFFEARRGRLHGFRWKDWADFRSGKPSTTISHIDQLIGLGDGRTRVFQVSKAYRSGIQAYVRPITKPVIGTLRAGIAGVELGADRFDVNWSTGLLTFSEPPGKGAEVTAGFEFDVPVRFDTDAIRISIASFNAGEIPDVPVLELRQ